MLDIACDVFLDDVADGLLHLWGRAEEPSAWYADGGTSFLQREELPELGFVGELDGTLVVTPASVFFATECSSSLVVFMPKESFHLFCDDDFPSVVVYGSIRQVGVEDDGVVGYSTVYAAPELSRVCEYCPALVPDGRLASLPSLGEESLAFEVLVELIFHVHGNVSENVFYDFLKVFWHIVVSLRENCKYERNISILYFE